MHTERQRKRDRAQKSLIYAFYMNTEETTTLKNKIKLLELGN